MKKTVSVSLGRRNFILDEEAYNTLGHYLDNFKASLMNGESAASSAEIMEELEMRIADLFREKLHGLEVVDGSIIHSVISQLGTPDGGAYDDGPDTASSQSYSKSFKARDEHPAPKRLFRNKDDKTIGGVCSGLALYFNIDRIIIRLAFVLAVLFGLAGFWAYVIFWIIIPPAKTAVEKCEMMGIPATPENISSFSQNKH